MEPQVLFAGMLISGVLLAVVLGWQLLYGYVPRAHRDTGDWACEELLFEPVPPAEGEKTKSPQAVPVGKEEEKEAERALPMQSPKGAPGPKSGVRQQSLRDPSPCICCAESRVCKRASEVTRGRGNICFYLADMFQGQYPFVYDNVVVNGGNPSNAAPRQCVMTVYSQWGPLPVPVVCPYCKRHVVTTIRSRPGFLTWMLCGSLAALGCVFGCCLFPFCIPSCQDNLHVCPSCNRILGVFRKI
ncbi:hypothetical protein ISCGN_026970 [Ixodes scapularis]